MKLRYFFLVLTSIFLLGSLAIWQLYHLESTQELKAELEKEEMQSILMNTAVTLREMERVDSIVRIDKARQFQVIDSLTELNFKDFDYNFQWAIISKNGKLDTDLSTRENSLDSSNSDFKVCVSCLVMINIVGESEEDTKSGFILNHSPAQMMNMRGMDESKIEFLHLWYDGSPDTTMAYIIPIGFLTGLGILFFGLLYMMRRQTLLIKQKNEFVNHLSHQFQTPLSSIKIGANLLAKKYENEELIQIIQTEGNHLENHIKTVLHWVKSDADRLQILKQDIRITDSIENALKEMKPVFQMHKTVVHFVPSEEEYTIKADKNHLQLVLFNIWENAIKHNDEAVSIYIQLQKKQSLLQILISDNGKGVQKLNDETKYKGLGLQYIETIMKGHGGTMELSNNQPTGFSVTLNFPIHE